MEIDVEGLCGAGHDEKVAGGNNSRIGYCERTRGIRAGCVELKIPKLRQGSYFPEFLEPRRTAERALTAVSQERPTVLREAGQAAYIDEAGNDVLAFMTFPRAQCSRIYSTNPLELLDAEINRRTNVVGILPNDAPLTHLVCAMTP